jgi:hypothetical protein
MPDGRFAHSLKDTALVEAAADRRFDLCKINPRSVGHVPRRPPPRPAATLRGQPDTTSPITELTPLIRQTTALRVPLDGG